MEPWLVSFDGEADIDKFEPIEASSGKAAVRTFVQAAVDSGRTTFPQFVHACPLADPSRTSTDLTSLILASMDVEHEIRLIQK